MKKQIITWRCEDDGVGITYNLTGPKGAVGTYAMVGRSGKGNRRLWWAVSLRRNRKRWEVGSFLRAHKVEEAWSKDGELGVWRELRAAYKDWLAS